ncbi:hypothetical protein NN3_53920 [Nocardia neocaledoniensis NBRC 108232]|uniref:Uncharacterized protein n=1 Tax=Nocardia neocaledoniensis TaxID=236511 RepID=A0A317NQF8_9NOCA|nr:hypothetical protein DFR69_103195 [Nocardia neocaledoniensis]GEM34385.1 hypothetical protein NN3_53920 [Nocardia neocaledoniensis NBRC 108232]
MNDINGSGNTSPPARPANGLPLGRILLAYRHKPPATAPAETKPPVTPTR